MHVLLCAESSNSDWWYVRKSITGERGWVPADYLMDEDNYSEYVEKKLLERIEALPIFGGEKNLN